ncbi:MAG: hypothetical protein WB797_04545, partial [Nocardioides sp.]
AQRRAPGRTQAGSGRHAGHRNDARESQRRTCYSYDAHQSGWTFHFDRNERPLRELLERLAE